MIYKRLALIILLSLLISNLSCTNPNPENILPVQNISDNTDYKITKFADKIYCVTLTKAFTNSGNILVFQAATVEIDKTEDVLYVSFGNSQTPSGTSNQDDLAFVFVK